LNNAIIPQTSIFFNRDLSVNILRPAWLSFAFFLPHYTVNGFSDLLGFFDFLFECVVFSVKRFPFGGQLDALGIDESRFAVGNRVGELAREYYGDYAEILYGGVSPSLTNHPAIFLHRKRLVI